MNGRIRKTLLFAFLLTKLKLCYLISLIKCRISKIMTITCSASQLSHSPSALENNHYQQVNSPSCVNHHLQSTQIMFFYYILKSLGRFIIEDTVRKFEATSNKLSGKPYTELRWDKERKQKLENNKSYIKRLMDIVTKILSKTFIQKFQSIITLGSTSIHFR